MNKYILSTDKRIEKQKNKLCLGSHLRRRRLGRRREVHYNLWHWPLLQSPLSITQLKDLQKQTYFLKNLPKTTYRIATLILEARGLKREKEEKDVKHRT